MKKLNVFLCGYHWVGCRVLEHLLEREDVGEIGVFTHEAKPPVPSVEALAGERGVRCTLVGVNDTTAWPFAPDIIISVYYRDIIKPHVIEAVRGRIFNLHPSLLPRHRGCSSLTWALIEGDTVAGLTYHYIDRGVDTGRILLQAALQVAPDETQATLYQRAMESGVAFWPAAFELVKAGFPGVPQQGEASLHKRGAPDGGQIDDSWPLERVERFIRAMTYPPYPYATYRGKEVRALEEYQRLRGA